MSLRIYFAAVAWVTLGAAARAEQEKRQAPPERRERARLGNRGAE